MHTLPCHPTLHLNMAGMCRNDHMVEIPRSEHSVHTFGIQTRASPEIKKKRINNGIIWGAVYPTINHYLLVQAAVILQLERKKAMCITWGRTQVNEYIYIYLTHSIALFLPSSNPVCFSAAKQASKLTIILWCNS